MPKIDAVSITSRDRVRIAAMAVCSDRTVDRIYKGLGVHSNTRAIVEAAAQQLDLPPPPLAADKQPDPAVPTEAQECTALANWLDRANVLYTHVPMGGLRDRKAAAMLRNMGAKRGVPDYLIFSVAPAWWKCTLAPSMRGVALEMKRRKGGTLSDQQKWWIAQLKLAGWHVIVARGARDAVAQLTALGYGQQTDCEVAR